MTAFDYVKPANLQQALAGLLQAGEDGAVLAGGTDLLVRIRAGRARPRILFDIHGIPELRGIAVDGDRLRIGAAATLAEIARSPLVRKKAPALAEAASQVGARQIRNRATLGGNIVNASPAADTLPPLVAAGARVVLAGARGRRELDIGAFLSGPGRTARRPDEILLEVLAPMDRPGVRSRFLKIGRRRALAISVVNLAARLEVTDGVMRDVRIALGAVAPTAVRAHGAETLLEGRPADRLPLAEAARLAAAEIAPIDDVRGTSRARRVLVETQLRRLLCDLVEGPNR